MRELYRVQTLQLKLIEIAVVNESCAADLTTILHCMEAADADIVRSIILSLQGHGEQLKTIAKIIVNTGEAHNPAW